MIATITSLLVGGVAALATIFALVTTTIGAPADNPADKPVITYGTNS